MPPASFPRLVADMPVTRLARHRVAARPLQSEKPASGGSWSSIATAGAILALPRASEPLRSRTEQEISFTHAADGRLCCAVAPGGISQIRSADHATERPWLARWMIAARDRGAASWLESLDAVRSRVVGHSPHGYIERDHMSMRSVSAAYRTRMLYCPQSLRHGREKTPRRSCVEKLRYTASAKRVQANI